MLDGSSERVRIPARAVGQGLAEPVLTEHPTPVAPLGDAVRVEHEGVTDRELYVGLLEMELVVAQDAEQVAGYADELGRPVGTKQHRLGGPGEAYPDHQTVIGAGEPGEGDRAEAGVAGVLEQRAVQPSQRGRRA